MSKVSSRTYEARTTWTSPDYTTIITNCQNCNATIKESVPKWNPPKHRVECYECLARWWNAKRLVPVRRSHVR